MTSNLPTYLPSIGRMLHFVGSAATLLSDRRLHTLGLTTKQWVALTALWREPRMSETALASYCQTSPSAMNRLVDRMSENELVRRGADPEDRRRVIVELAEEGERLSSLVEFYHEINAVLLEGFSQEEEKAFVSFLERAEKNVRNALGEAS